MGALQTPSLMTNKLSMGMRAVLLLALFCFEAHAKFPHASKIAEAALDLDIESSLEEDWLPAEVPHASQPVAEHSPIADLETGMYGGGGGHHGPHGSSEKNTYALVILCTVFAIALMTIGFEHGEHVLKHHAKIFRPVVDALFSELTVGGFMALIAFCFSEVPIIYDPKHIKRSLLQILSEKIFPSDKTGGIIPHAFHEIHLIIFMNMVFLAILVVSGLGYIVYKCEQMRKFEE